MYSYIEEIVGGIIAMVFGAGAWLVRTVLTNQTEIDLLKEEIKSRDEKRGLEASFVIERREEDRAVLMEIRDDLKGEMRDIKKDVGEVRNEVLQIIKTRK